MHPVALFRSTATAYPSPPPFHPPADFPELVRAGIRGGDVGNDVYRGVRELLTLLRLDQPRLGTADWNPLGAYIRPGDRVVIKPNLVLHEFGPQKNACCLTTHGSVIRAVLDYVYLAVGPEGCITIADAPLQGADFERVSGDAGLPQIQEFYRDRLHCEIRILDLRQLHAVIDESSSLVRRVERLPGDPQGYCEIELGKSSRLQELDALRPCYVIGDYDAAITNVRHQHSRHSYVVSRSVLEADAVISVPKLKTHSKTGLTVCLKNAVGIIGSKDCLPHHRQGKSEGDEFAPDYPARWRLSAFVHDRLQGRVPVSWWRLLRWSAQAVLGAGTPHDGRPSDFYPAGAWPGNDTIWRTVEDLNRILRFYDPARASLQPEAQRRYFAVVDGIVAMEGNGPLRGTPKPAGVILGGDDPLAVDMVAATLMGMKWQRIRLLQGMAGAVGHAADWENEAIALLSNAAEWNSLASLARHHLAFHPPNGWRGRVEIPHVA
ncbi:MAG TPA: DUF362 domain-containing protein [Terriglobales bacterium]|nr:DUF362 domain-containing protein [Terriglobales bacterium]